MSIVEQYRQYFSITNDAAAHFYEVGRSPYPSPLANGPQSFGDDTYQIELIDQFKGKRPTLFNLEFMRSSARYDLNLVVTAILDSQLVSELHAFCQNRDKMRPDKKLAVEQFLNWVSAHNYDFNPCFYFVESFCKSSHDNFMSAVTPVAASILHLHAMDEERFIENGDIVPKTGAIEHYQDKYKASSLDECAKMWLSEFISTEIRRFKPLVDTTYACLLKMVLIHKKDRRLLVDKLIDFEKFMYGDLGARLARESLFAAYYFADLLGSMVGAQANSNYSKSKKNLRATAWDILLLRFPEFLLNPFYLPEINLAYVCSADKKLIEIGRMFEIEMLAVRSDNTIGALPAIEMNYAPIEKKVGKIIREKIFNLSDEIKNCRIVIDPVRSFNEEKIGFLISDLESQLRNLCSG